MKKILLVAAAAALVTACASSKNGPVRVPDPREMTGELREWSNIYSVDYEGEKKVRTKIGYLLRKWEEKSPQEHKYWIRNLEQETIGFINPDNKAYQVRKVPGKADPEVLEMGSMEVSSAVKKIFLAPGTIEFEKVIAPAAAPAKPAATPPPQMSE